MVEMLLLGLHLLALRQLLGPAQRHIGCAASDGFPPVKDRWTHANGCWHMHAVSLGTSRKGSECALTCRACDEIMRCKCQSVGSGCCEQKDEGMAHGTAACSHAQRALGGACCNSHCCVPCPTVAGSNTAAYEPLRVES